MNLWVKLFNSNKEFYHGNRLSNLSNSRCNSKWFFKLSKKVVIKWSDQNYTLHCRTFQKYLGRGWRLSMYIKNTESKDQSWNSEKDETLTILLWQTLYALNFFFFTLGNVEIVHLMNFNLSGTLVKWDWLGSIHTGNGFVITAKYNLY